MDYPRFVFKSPGEIKSAGETYDQEIVDDEDEYKAAIKAGYSDTISEALGLKPGEIPVKKKPFAKAKVKIEEDEF